MQLQISGTGTSGGAVQWQGPSLFVKVSAIAKETNELHLLWLAG